MHPVNFFPAADIVVIGTDPECADFDNPRGHRHGFAAYVVAEDREGNRRRQFVCVRRREDAALAIAQRVAQALQTRLETLGKPPVAFDAWEAHRPAYGSLAWTQYGEADEIALERREAEEEAWA